MKSENWYRSMRDPAVVEKKASFHRGRKRTEETRARMHLAHLGKKHSEATKDRLSELNLGKTIPDDVRARMSLGMKESLRRRGGHAPHVIAAWQAGHKRWAGDPARADERSANAYLGRPVTKEHREKLCAARRRRVMPLQDTAPERAITWVLSELAIPFVKHRPITGFQRKSGLFHAFDVLIPSLRVAIEIDGCYWHACQRCYPDGRRKYDDLVHDLVAAACGWRVVRIWEHEIASNDPAALISCLRPS